MHLTSSSPSTFVQLVMKLCSTCINMTHSHNVYCSCNPCRDKKCRDKNRMSSLNVFAIFRGFHLNSFKFQDVSRCFKMFQKCLPSPGHPSKLAHLFSLFSLYRGSKMCNGQATSTKTGPESRKRIKMVNLNQLLYRSL